MPAASVTFLVFLLLIGKIGSQSESSSGLGIQDTIKTLNQKVLRLEDSVADKIPQMIKEENEETLQIILDKMFVDSETLRTNVVSEMGETMREAFQALSSRMEQMNLKLNKLSSQLKDPQRLFEETFTLRAHYIDHASNAYNFTCSSEENDQKIEFSRILDTGTGGTLPRGAKTYTLGKTAVLDLSGVDIDDKRGVYQCGYETEGKRKGITFALQINGNFFWPRLASVGDTVEFYYPYPNDPSLRWLHDGEPIPAGDGKPKLTIAGVKADDSGIYELYQDGDRRRSQGFFRLVVRGCPEKFFGERCDQECPTCLNGGSCHHLFGSCVCPPGFEGSSCEVECGENRVGPNCSESCEGRDCKHQVFCKPDPFGCSCAPGYRGYSCEEI